MRDTLSDSGAFAGGVPVFGPGAGRSPVAERCAGEFLSLPMFPELTLEQVRAVADELKLCLSAAKPQAACAR